MKEIIAKSKMHKYQRQKLKEDDDQLRMELDEELKEIKGLLSTSYNNRKPLTSQSSLFRQADHSKPEDDEQEQADQYDQFVRQLAFDQRAKASDRLKTEEEEALEEKNRLEKLERHRIRRMEGLNSDTEDDSDDDNQQSKSSKLSRPSQGDDLDGDFEDMSNPLNMGDGLKQYQIDEDDEDEDEDDDDDDEDEDDEDEDDEGASDLDLEDGESDADELDSDAELDSRPTKRTKKASSNDKNQELPYTFTFPNSYDEFISLVSDYNSENKNTIFSRLRVIYHAKLSPANKEKLQSLLGYLLDYIHDLTIIDPFPSADINVVVHHIIELSSQFPDHLAQLAIEQLQNFRDEFNQEDNEDFPTLGHLVTLKLYSQVFSASDYYHSIITPSSLLIGQYLSQMNYSTPDQLGKQLFLCGIFLEMQSLSKRYVPECVGSILNILYIISPPSVKNHLKKFNQYPFSRQILSHTSLELSSKFPSEPSESQLQFGLLNFTEHEYYNSDSYTGSLLNIGCNLLTKLTQLYQDIPSFTQMVDPFRVLLQSYVDQAKLSEAYKVNYF
jgi:nucleolar protein 14